MTPEELDFLSGQFMAERRRLWVDVYTAGYRNKVPPVGLTSELECARDADLALAEFDRRFATVPKSGGAK